MNFLFFKFFGEERQGLVNLDGPEELAHTETIFAEFVALWIRHMSISWVENFLLGLLDHYKEFKITDFFEWKKNITNSQELN